MDRKGRTGGAGQVSIQTDISEPVRMLTELGGKKTTVMRNILSGIGTAAKKPVKAAYRQVGLKKRTGALYKSIQRKVFRNAKAVMVQAKAQRDGKTFYGYALARGSKITAKKGKYLTFQIDGKWVKAHSVQLKAHDFVEAPVKRYLLSSDFKAKLDQLVEKEVIKIEKKARRKTT